MCSLNRPGRPASPNELAKKIIFSLLYWIRPPWDTDVPVPELQRAVAGCPPARALDLGCGTGTNMRYLAERGWQVTGIDYVPRAIAQARRKLARWPATVLVGDVTRLAELALPGPFALALDVGCFHNLSPAGQPSYAAGLRRWLQPGGVYLLYAWQPSRPGDRRGLAREAVLQVFAAGFKPTGYEPGRGRPSAWYYFERLPDP